MNPDQTQTPDPTETAMHRLVDALVASTLAFAADNRLSHAEIVGALELAKLTLFELTMEKAREMKNAGKN